MGNKGKNCSVLARDYRAYNRLTLRHRDWPVRRPTADEVSSCKSKTQGLTVRRLRGPGRAAGANFVLWPRTHARVRFGAEKYKKSRAGAAYAASLLSAGLGKKKARSTSSARVEKEAEDVMMVEAAPRWISASEKMAMKEGMSRPAVKRTNAQRLKYEFKKKNIYGAKPGPAYIARKLYAKGAKRQKS